MTMTPLARDRVTDRVALRSVLPSLALLALVLASPPTARAGTADAVAGGLLTTLGTGVVCATGAMATDEDSLEGDEKTYARPGFTAGLRAVFARNLFQSDLKESLRKEFGMPVQVDTENSFGLDASVGYRCHRRFAVETQVEWLNGFDSDVKSGTPAAKVGWDQYEPIVFTTNAKVYALTGQMQPYVLVGAGGITSKEKVRNKTIPFHPKVSERENDFVMRFGVGLDYYWSENIVLRVNTDYVRPFGALEDFDYVSIGWGAEYRF